MGDMNSACGLADQPPYLKRGISGCVSNNGVSLLSLLRKPYDRELESRLRLIVTPRIQKEQCRLHPGHGTVDQLFILASLMEQSAYMCLMDLDLVLQEYGILGFLLQAFWSVYNWSESCVCILCKKSNTFLVGVSLCQGCPLSLILCVIFMDRVSRCSRGEECVQFKD